MPHSAPNEFCQNHIDSIEKVADLCSDMDMILVCGDFNLTNITWIYEEATLCPLNVTSERECILTDGMSDCDLTQMNSVPNQYGVFLDLMFCNFPELLSVRIANESLLKLDRHHPAFILN